MVEHATWQPKQLEVTNLGSCRIDSPLTRSTQTGTGLGSFVPDDTRVLYEPRFRQGEEVNMLAFERAGARKKIFFDPAKTKAAIVTCGGLCPGINNVIRTLVLELNYNYGVKRIAGIRFGFQGFDAQQGLPPLELTPEQVESIHHQGGTILGTSRGHQQSSLIVDSLVDQGVDILFCIGGDGTQHGAHTIAKEIAKRKLSIALVGIPKTIDNDIKFCFRTFGFFTAVSEAEKIIDCAHTEAKGVLGGVGLVKFMGREAGFIAAAATLASGEANFTLIPEVPFELDGPQGFLASLRRRIEARQHAVVVIAEGAGQHLIPNQAEQFDASGNRRLHDIGPFLKQQILEHFKAEQVPVNVKYFDPSYHIRSVAANAADSLLCEQLARKAVHAGMAGKTDILIGLWHNHLIHVPLELSTGEKKQLSPEGELWTSVLALTGQEKWKEGVDE